MWYIHTMHNIFRNKTNEVLIDATTWMDRENMQVEEASNKRPNNVYFHSHKMPRMGKSIHTGSRLAMT